MEYILHKEKNLSIPLLGRRIDIDITCISFCGKFNLDFTKSSTISRFFRVHLKKNPIHSEFYAWLEKNNDNQDFLLHMSHNTYTIFIQKFCFDALKRISEYMSPCTIEYTITNKSPTPFRCHLLDLYEMGYFEHHDAHLAHIFPVSCFLGIDVFASDNNNYIDLSYNHDYLRIEIDMHDMMADEHYRFIHPIISGLIENIPFHQTDIYKNVSELWKVAHLVNITSDMIDYARLKPYWIMKYFNRLMDCFDECDVHDHFATSIMFQSNNTDRYDYVPLHKKE